MATHHMTKSPTWRVWIKMRERCNDSNHLWYKNYGGRGIKVCDRWQNSFENFFADMGERPEGMTIERKDGNKDYSPGNCIWATRKEQARNTRKNVVLVFNNESHCLAEWSEITSIPVGTLQFRISHGWPVSKALFEKVKATKGSSHNFAVLSEKDVIEIRRLYETGKHTYASLSSIYRITMQGIWKIIKRQNWKHI